MTPYLRIMEASKLGRGVRLTPEEVDALASDDGRSLELEAANERLRADISTMGKRLTTACLALAEARRERDDARLEIADAGHSLRIVYPDYGGGRPYVEVSEQHDGEAWPVRTWPLPEAVHLLQNIDDDAFHRIGCSDPPASSGHMDERRRIVRYLRGIGSGPAELLADQIEAGEHRTA